MAKIHKTPHIFTRPLVVDDEPSASEQTLNADYSLNLSTSSVGAFGLPLLNSSSRDLLTGIAGMKIWNTTTTQEEIYNGSSWVASGSGGGGGSGSTILNRNRFTNPDFDNTTGVSSYDDGGSFVDGTGGTTSHTISSVSSGVIIDGTNSLSWNTGSGTDKSGEGLTLSTTIDDLGDFGREVYFRFDIYPQSVTGFSIGDITVHSYQTNVNSIVPIRFTSGVDQDTGNLLFSLNKLTTVSGYIEVQDVSSSYDLRLSLHIEGSATNSFTARLDRYFCGFVELPLIPSIVGDWASYTPIFAGLGTPTDVNFWYRQVGDTLEIKGNFVTGTTTATEALVSLPSGFSIDTSKINSTADIETFGYGIQPTGGGASSWVADVSAQGITAFYDGVNTDSFEITNQGASDVNNSRLANALWASGERMIFPLITIPLANASSNIAVGAASTFRMAPILANGTEVSGVAPNVLGQWRPFRRNAAATTYNETTATPTDLPTAANGVRIYSTSNWSVASAINEPSRYEFFIGKNKKYELEWYSSAGKTGVVDVSVETDSTLARGARTSYDPTTGVLSVWQSVRNTATGNTNIGEDVAGVVVPDPYFDIIVSENVQAIGFEPQNKVQIKTLSSTLSVDTNPISDLTFSNLVIGKLYRVTLQADILGGDNLGTVDILHNSTVIGRVRSKPNSVGATNDEAIGSTSTIVLATASTITFSFDEISTNTLFGNGTQAGTWAMIEELNNTEQVTTF